MICCKVPQFILDDWIQQGRGTECNIIVTQVKEYLDVIHEKEDVALQKNLR